MKEDPLPSDWCEVVKRDFSNIGVHMSDKHIEMMDEHSYKTLIKTKTRKAVLKELKDLQDSHGKVKHILFSNLNNPQEYLTSGMLTNDQSSLLFNLRCQTVNGFKDNFHGMYSNYNIYLETANGSDNPILPVDGGEEHHPGGQRGQSYCSRDNSGPTEIL